MTVGLNITEACVASHGCFLLLRCPEPLQRKERPLCCPSLSSALMWPRSWKIYGPTRRPFGSCGFADFGAVGLELNCNKKLTQTQTRV